MPKDDALLKIRTSPTKNLQPMTIGLSTDKIKNTRLIFRYLGNERLLPLKTNVKIRC